ncbi:ubiquinone anaerobic biosynthesis protein UbiU [Viridibacterium curvum]|uniref:Ubiquinone biosynthesis protein UbiU n=1 Tax=Viridibacterium curvum TaxID=1101404 RepID=A0ABP9R8P1_9RHOO
MLTASTTLPPRLICPAGSLPALKAAIDHGADAVYLGLKDATNARNFTGLNFDARTAREGVDYAHRRGRQVLLAINTYAQAGEEARWRAAVDAAAELGVDAVILADMGLLDYATRIHPTLRRHLSVQASCTSYEAINLCRDLFGIQRAVLPRVLTLAQVAHVIQHTTVEIEVFGFGSLCVMVEGRCLLSSYATGESPNTAGVCSPAKAVRWTETARGTEARLSGVLIDTYTKGEAAGYPTLCKGRFAVNGETYYALEEPTSLNIVEALPELLRIGVAAIKVEGRQRSPAYVAEVTRTLRAAIDAAIASPERFNAKPAWQQALGKVSEGQHVTLGAYARPWK